MFNILFVVSEFKENSSVFQPKLKVWGSETSQFFWKITPVLRFFVKTNWLKKAIQCNCTGHGRAFLVDKDSYSETHVMFDWITVQILYKTNASASGQSSLLPICWTKLMKWIYSNLNLLVFYNHLNAAENSAPLTSDLSYLGSSVSYRKQEHVFYTVLFFYRCFSGKSK